MKNTMKTLLINLLNYLDKKKGIKWRFNFCNKEDSLVETYSSEIKIKDKITGIRICKNYSFNGIAITYDIAIDDLSFTGYIDSEIKNRLQSIVEFIEKNDLVSMYPSSVQKLIDFSQCLNNVNTIKENNLEENEIKNKDIEKFKDKLGTGYIYFSLFWEILIILDRLNFYQGLFLFLILDNISIPC